MCAPADYCTIFERPARRESSIFKAYELCGRPSCPIAAPLARKSGNRMIIRLL